MTKRDKLRQKLRNNPGGVKFADLETLLLRFDFVLIRVTGSHHVFRHKGQTESVKLVIPAHGNNVKPEYVTSVIETIDMLFPETDKGEAADDDE